MSRTRRRVLTHREDGPGVVERQVGERERKKAFVTDIKRDNRVTGLREHRAHRQQARRELRSEEDTVRQGKVRRYGTFYGAYEW